MVRDYIAKGFFQESDVSKTTLTIGLIIDPAPLEFF